MKHSYDIAIVGAGIIGLSAAWHLQRRLPDRKIVVLEKESDIAIHQSDRNSGVLHAGIYYTPGSLKARFCTAGRAAALAFCEQNDIPVLRCGKFIVALDSAEVLRLTALRRNAEGNGVEVEYLSQDQLRERAPGIPGVAALWSPSTAAVNFRSLAVAMARRFEAAGGRILRSSQVSTWHHRRDAVVLESNDDTVHARFVAGCAGLHAEHLARLAGLNPAFRIVPFRGEYYEIKRDRLPPIQQHIYPVPAPDLPFLGVHVTQTVDGRCLVGPNAVLALSREGYRWTVIDPNLLARLAGFVGLWRMVARHPRAAFSELASSLSRRAYVARIKRYLPDLESGDLVRARSGVRAQAVARDGSLLHDFAILDGSRSLHVCNAPSPAATSALPIGDYLATRIIERIGD